MKQILFILLALLTFEGISCSCMSPERITEQEVQEYDLILTGSIEKIEKGEWTNVIHLKIRKLYKGTACDEIVTVTTPSQSGMCGIFPKAGEIWLIYATERNEIFSTDLCTRTKTMNSEAWDYNPVALKDDIEFLEQRLE